MNIKWVGASDSNYSEGRQGNSIQALVIHWISGDLASADATFSNPENNVSAHYGIEGEIVHQYVKEEDTAWHCGDWLWNLKTIGIEHSGGPDLPIDFETYKTSAQLVKEIAERHNIPIDKEHILPHSYFVPTSCPGDFDIERLIDLALGYETDQDRIEYLENEVAELTSQRDRKDRKLETCRVERADYKSEVVEVREQYQQQVAELNQTNSSLSNDVQRLTLEIDKKDESIATLESSKNSLESAVGALKSKLTKERRKYTEMEEKYTECNDKLNDFVKDMSVLKFIWRKLVH